MAEILLVRHGQASWGADDYDVLSPLGERQGPVTGRALSSIAPSRVLHGSLRRQRETAAYVAQGAGWPLAGQTDARWNELDHRAIMEFAPRPTSPSPTPEEFSSWFERAMDRWHGGEHDDEYEETWPAFRTRVLDALDDLAGDLGEDDSAVVVTSGGPISVVTSALLGGETAMYRGMINGVVNCSVTRIRRGRQGLRIASFNEHTHLTGDFLTYI